MANRADAQDTTSNVPVPKSERSSAFATENLRFNGITRDKCYDVLPRRPESSLLRVFEALGRGPRAGGVHHTAGKVRKSHLNSSSSLSESGKAHQCSWHGSRRYKPLPQA